MKLLRLIFLSAVIINLISCVTRSQLPTANSKITPEEPELETAKTLLLSGKQITEDEPGDFISWKCRDYSYGGRTLVEVGQVILPKDYKDRQGYNEIDESDKEKFDELAGMIGFVLYDGTNTGDFALYRRRGLNHRWDWAPDGGKYAFVIEPDGTGLYYDFSTAEDGVKRIADDVYKCSR